VAIDIIKVGDDVTGADHRQSRYVTDDEFGLRWQNAVATPLFRMHVYHSMSPVIRKRRRRPMIGTNRALLAQSKKVLSASGYFKTSCVCRPLLVAPACPPKLPRRGKHYEGGWLGTPEFPPEQTQFKTALKYQLVNSLRNICGNFFIQKQTQFFEANHRVS
jgi:hypothetical protein